MGWYEVSVSGAGAAAAAVADSLERAGARTGHLNLQHVRELQIMDAESMDFADNAFDKVVAMYVASVVPNPTALVDEMRRVCRPDGEIFIVNHFRTDNPIVGTMEKLIAKRLEEVKT